MTCELSPMSQELPVLPAPVGRNDRIGVKGLILLLHKELFHQDQLSAMKYERRDESKVFVLSPLVFLLIYYLTILPAFSCLLFGFD